MPQGNLLATNLSRTHSVGPKLDPATADLDCHACGACCAGGFDCVEVAPSDPFATLHADLLVKNFGQLQLPRPGGRCVCLEGQAPALRCRFYACRPQHCQDFPVGGPSCIEARRRVGLTP